MPNQPANDAIANFVVDMGWFQSHERIPNLSDNWRRVKNIDGSVAILYVEFFGSTSGSGEPRRLPNHKSTKDGEGTLPKLRRLNRELPTPRTGPFIALAELTSDDKVVNIRVWNIVARIGDNTKSLSFEELLAPAHIHPRVVGAQTVEQEDGF